MTGLWYTRKACLGIEQQWWSKVRARARVGGVESGPGPELVVWLGLQLELEIGLATGAGPTWD